MKKWFDGTDRSSYSPHFPSYPQLRQANTGGKFLLNFAGLNQKLRADRTMPLIKCSSPSIEFLISGGRLCRGTKQRGYGISTNMYRTISSHPTRFFAMVKKHYVPKSSGATNETTGNLHPNQGSNVFLQLICGIIKYFLTSYLLF